MEIQRIYTLNMTVVYMGDYNCQRQLNFILKMSALIVCKSSLNKGETEILSET